MFGGNGLTYSGGLWLTFPATTELDSVLFDVNGMCRVHDDYVSITICFQLDPTAIRTNVLDTVQDLADGDSKLKTSWHNDSVKKVWSKKEPTTGIQPITYTWQVINETGALLAIRISAPANNITICIYENQGGFPVTFNNRPIIDGEHLLHIPVVNGDEAVQAKVVVLCGTDIGGASGWDVGHELSAIGEQVGT